ncbi:MAG: alpha/beta hydrolase [Sneathiella sp.]
MTPTQKFIQTSSVNLSYFEWGDPADPTILFIHATGMHGRIWDQTIKALPSGYHIIALDQRGHGMSVSDTYLLDWTLMGNDAIEFITGLGLENITGVGHSMGGHVLTQATLALPHAFKSILLIDPVIFPPEKYQQTSDFEKGSPSNHPLARRRNQFNNWQHMVESFSKREPYSLWDSKVLKDYCQYGLVKEINGSVFSLACAPDVEASVYMGHLSVDLTDKLSHISQPVYVMRAKERDKNSKHQIDFSASPTWDELSSKFERGEDIWLKDLTHFIPMQEPALTAKYIHRLYNLN